EKKRRKLQENIDVLVDKRWRFKKLAKKERTFYLFKGVVDLEKGAVLAAHKDWYAYRRYTEIADEVEAFAVAKLAFLEEEQRAFDLIAQKIEEERLARRRLLAAGGGAAFLVLFLGALYVQKRRRQDPPLLRGPFRGEK
ncbi:MAG: hypothetical protein IH914_05220, partial [candidate division Zixibacteria bacterium]|nr:hypothetical protein [candidate division Zixibacteria bacterium]